MIAESASADFFIQLQLRFIMFYKGIIRPVLFLFPPEIIHHFIVNTLRFSFRLPFVKNIVQKIFAVQDKRMETEIAGLKFPNKVGLAAGFDKKANIYNELASFGFGHIEVGTVNPLPQPGNPKPRLFRLKKDKALINRMGFNNPGVDVFVQNLKKNAPEIIIGGNIGKNTLTPEDQTVRDYLICFAKMYDQVDYFVVNVSCPNIEGLSKLQDKDELIVLLEHIQNKRKEYSIQKPVFLKIAPDLNHSQLDDVIEITEKCNLDGIIATNTSAARQHLSTPAEDVRKVGKGGLSGKPLKDISNATIRYIAKKTNGKIPIIGVGGIMTAEDAIEKLRAGASLIQIYTGFVYEGPWLVKRINKSVQKNLHP